MDEQEILIDQHGGRLVSRFQVRLAETDAQGVVYYGSFFIYFEVARLALLRAAGFDLARARPETGTIYLVRAECDYRERVHYLDRLTVETRVEHLGRSSICFHHLVLLSRHGDARQAVQAELPVCAEARDTLVWVDGSGRPAELPPGLRAGLARFTVATARWPGGETRGWTVVVGSQNPAKVAAARAVMRQVDPSCRVVECDATGVAPVQPRGWESTRAGALARAQYALSATGEGQLGIGMESGLVERGPDLLVESWCAVVDRKGRESVALSAGLPLPAPVAERLRQDPRLELGPLIDDLAGRPGAARSEGAIGVLTGGVTGRRSAWEQALIYALAPWLREDLFHPACGGSGAPAGGEG